MYSDCVASSSRHPLHSPPGPPNHSFSFPTSSIRNETRFIQQATTLPSSSYNTPSTPTTPAPPRTTFSTAVPQRVQVSPGLWFDGQRTVLCAALPEVQRVLATARNTLKLSPTSSDVVFALAALHVFYSPGDPAHWLFWSDEQKNKTAEVVTRISLHNPPLITSPVSWNGTPEYLSILANHHGPTWRHVFEPKPWFTIIVPPKAPTPVRVPNLRKRKVAPGAFREQSKSPAIDESEEGDEPPPKRVRTTRQVTPDRADSAGCANAFVEEESAPVRPSRAKARSKVSTATSTTHPLLDQSQDFAPATLPDAMVEDDPPIDELPATKRASTRKRRKISPASRYPHAIISSRETSSSLGETLIPSNTSHSSSPPPTHSRNRSTSEASAKTAVESDERRSMSVLSSETAVEALSSKKRKPTASVSEEAKELDEGTPPVDAEEGMVTRGRALRARPKITHVDPLLEAACGVTKLDKAATAKAPRARRIKV